MNIIKLFRCSLLILAFIFVGLDEVRASDSSTYISPDWNEKQATDWQTAKEQILAIRQSALSNQQKCQQAWNIAWPLAKAGNLEARYIVFNAIRDGLSLFYDDDTSYIIATDNIKNFLYLYSLGAPSMRIEIARMQKMLQANPRHINNFPEFKRLESYPIVSACVVERPSQACITPLVEKHITRSFERVAKEMDMIFTAGVNVPCITNPNGPNIDSPIYSPRPLVDAEIIKSEEHEE